MLPLPDFGSQELKVKRLFADAIIPTRAHFGDLGLDLYAREEVELQPGNVTVVGTGIVCGFPYGFGGLIRDRSSIATKLHAFVVAGVIDNGYRGEIKVAFYLPFHETKVTFAAGDKIAQMILTPVYSHRVCLVEELDAHTARGEGGFGSSGTR